MRPYWITLEGIEGVGKTYLPASWRPARRPRHVAGRGHRSEAETLTGQVITALSRAGDLWLRTGHPRSRHSRPGPEGQRVREPAGPAATGRRGCDRGSRRGLGCPLSGRDPCRSARVRRRAHTLAQQIYATAAHWRPLPDPTLLLVDDFDVCLARFEQRTGRTVSSADRALMRRVAELYANQAALEPERFRTVNRAGRSRRKPSKSCTRHAPAKGRRGVTMRDMTLLWALRSPCNLGCQYCYFGTIEEDRATPRASLASSPTCP